MDEVNEARELARRCEHNPYRWMCGGLTVNQHTLSDFLKDNGDWLDRQIAPVVAGLEGEGLPCGQGGMQ